LTICGEWSLRKWTPPAEFWKKLACRSWNCDECRGLRRRQLMARAAKGKPFSFITLTVNPSCYADPEERLRKLAWAWRVYVQRLRREHPGREIEYLAIVEATLAGEPHLHILFRGPFVPQGHLSAAMGELINAPIVDIRRVKNATQAAYYVAKYITKKPEQFGTSKRYWGSRNYALDDGEEWVPPTDPSFKWTIERVALFAGLTYRTNQGHAARQHVPGILAVFGVTDPYLCL